MIVSKRIANEVIIFFIITVVITILTISFKENVSISSLYGLFIYNFIATLIINSLCATTGRFVTYFLKSKPLMIELCVALGLTLCAGAIGQIINYYLNKFVFLNIIMTNVKTFDDLVRYSIPMPVIITIATTIAVCAGRMYSKNSKLEKKLSEIKLQVESHLMKGQLSILENKLRYTIKYDDLIYISSRGKKTMLHTTGRDYETNQLIKNIQDKLSDSFIRIHKQFIINTKYLFRIKYHKGGRYIAYLNDDYDVLPVSRKIASSLKDRLGI